LVQVVDQLELQLSRTFRAPIDDVWTSVTEPERTARWIGPWEGEGTPGNDITLKMIYEDQSQGSAIHLHIDACEAPRLLAVSADDDHGTWRIELRLTQTGDTTELQLVHLLESTDGLGEAGPGWEYYLDMLVAAEAGTEQPTFDDYYPSQKPYYEGLIIEQQ
jgi:uncharacterized protein YndB with AHSA1/START domain